MGSLTLQTEDVAKFVADSSIAKALRNGIAYVAHVPPDRVVVSLRGGANLVQLHADEEAASGLAEITEHRARTNKPGRVLVSYNITIPARKASQSGRIMQDLRNQTPSSIGSLLAREVGKVSNGTKYNIKVLAMETPTANPVGRRSTPTRSAAAHIWKPLAFI